jgi:hypothetical protein
MLYQFFILCVQKVHIHGCRHIKFKRHIHSEKCVYMYFPNSGNITLYQQHTITRFDNLVPWP